MRRTSYSSLKKNLLNTYEVFKREDNDLIANLKIPLVEALAGPPAGTKEKVLVMLDGRKLWVAFPIGVVKPGQQTRLNGEGMPIRKDGALRTKGDLIVVWEVVFSDSLTASQKEGVKRFWDECIIPFIIRHIYLRISTSAALSNRRLFLMPSVPSPSSPLSVHPDDVTGSSSSHR
jgi:DnaJ-class molecular chaperone